MAVTVVCGREAYRDIKIYPWRDDSHTTTQVVQRTRVYIRSSIAPRKRCSGETKFTRLGLMLSKSVQMDRIHPSRDV